MLMASPSLMELQVHDSISGHLQQLTMKTLASTIICCNPFVLVQTPTIAGHIKFLPSLGITISVTLAILDLATHALKYTKTIHCGMVRGVVLLVPAANSTTLLGSAQHCHNPLLS